MTRLVAHYHLKHALDQRARRAQGSDVPESDHLDILKAFEPHVSVLFRLAVVGFVLAIVAVIAVAVTR